MSWETWVLFLITETVLCLSPGPAVLLVLSQALTRGARGSMLSSAGILSANTLYFVLSATSLGALLLASYDLFFLVKWIGAAYLIYLGASAFFEKTSVLVVARDAGAGEAGTWELFGNGFVLQAANPKNLLFFAAIVPQFIDMTRPLGLQIAILGVTSVGLEFFILLGYGLLASRATRLATQQKFVAWTNRLAGSMLIGAGLGLAALRKP
jgi:homoserine/homoserine lactone efflux protein